ncbi:MAG TPA: EAL domain-containing protein [Vicinamibacteria bacterium]|nr:EAL domain-containing protein [Vicinamibacteria bacterium]
MSLDRTAPSFGTRRDTLRLTPHEADEERHRLREARASAGAAGLWVLESHLDGDGTLQRTPLQPLPFLIGRGAGLQLIVQSPHVSKTHAEIYSDGLALRVRDLGSRNGTFLNRQPVAEAPLHDGDVLHFGDAEFRVARDLPPDDETDETEDDGTLIRTAPLSRHFLAGASLVPRLIEQGAVMMLFQPIVTLSSGRVAAYEALGRGLLEGLPESPVELFDLAGAVGPDAQSGLSQLFRRKAVELVRDRPEPPVLFLNTHPVELEMPGLLESLEELRTFAPQVDLVLEIHESALAQPDYISWLRGRLLEINVGLAYDDFGQSQRGLFELAEAPPHYLKFDRRFVTGLHEAPTSRQRLVASLVAAARELLVKTVAEGVETADEAAACLRAGFTHAQGYHYGRPGPVEAPG